MDALGRHASQTVTGQATQTYAYLGSSDTVVAITSGGSTTTSAIDAVGDRVATASSGSFGYLLADLHGNMAAAFNAAGTSFSDAFAYDAWGEVVSSVTSSLPTPWRYQGRILESAAGTPDLYDFGARSYAPGIGAFTSLDSVHGSAMNPRLLNGYLYANANPATLVDPSGHYSEPTCARGTSLVYYGSYPSCQPTPTPGQKSIDDEESKYQAASRHAPAEAQYAASIKAQNGLNDEQSYYKAEARYAQSRPTPSGPSGSVTVAAGAVVTPITKEMLDNALTSLEEEGLPETPFNLTARLSEMSGSPVVEIAIRGDQMAVGWVGPDGSMYFQGLNAVTRVHAEPNTLGPLLDDSGDTVEVFSNAQACGFCRGGLTTMMKAMNGKDNPLSNLDYHSPYGSGRLVLSTEGGTATVTEDLDFRMGSPWQQHEGSSWEPVRVMTAPNEMGVAMDDDAVPEPGESELTGVEMVP